MTSCQYLPKLRKVIATTERSIVIWDHRAKAKNQSSIHVIKPLEHSPQCMCLVPNDDDHSDSLLIGDDAGYINLIRLTHNDFVVKTKADQKRVMKYHIIDPATLTIPWIRRKFHHDWVLQVQYLPDLKSFASCSPGDKLSFVIASIKRLHDTQAVSELSIPRGVNAFCYSEKSNIFATGGVDKTIRVWHPNILSRPTGKMVGHLFTIVDIVMNEKDQHVISLSTARVFRVWDIHTLACLQVFTDNDERSGDRRISSMLFDARHDRLITGSNTMDLWPMTRTVQDTMSVPHTHDHPLTTVVINSTLSQVVTICTESIIKVWEVETGRQMYQILEAHGPNVEVLSVAIDGMGTRMISGAYDGSLKVWEFSSGQEMKSYSLEDGGDDDQSVFSLRYITDSTNVPIAEDQHSHTDDEVFINEGETKDVAKQPVTRRVLALGWNNKLKIFQDDDESSDLIMMQQFDGMFEWPISPEPSTSSIYSPVGSEAGEGRKPVYQDNDEEMIPRKEDVLMRNEVTCLALCNEPELANTLISGCSNGNLVLWDYMSGTVSSVFELAKAELASSYDSHRHRSKEQFPHRINDVIALRHTIFRPDPEEVARRRKLRRKRMIEEGLIDPDENDEDQEKNPDDNEGKAEDAKDLDAVDEAQEDDPGSEVDLDIEGSSGEEDEGEENSGELDERKLGFGIDNEPIKMVPVKFPPVVVSCHQDTFVRFWSSTGELLCSVNPMTRILSPVTASCSDEHANQLIVADAKGYVTVWDVSEFLERPQASASIQARTELIKQIICWRAHLTKIVDLTFVNSSRVLITASTDGSVRIWYPHRGHYVGYFGQHRIWHISNNPSLPSSPVLPYDITEGPLNPVNARTNRRKTQKKNFEYPLVFDADRWRPFRRSAYARDVEQRNTVLTNQQPGSLNIIEIRNKNFFSALVKPKADKSGLESDKPVDSDTGAIFHHLPVYRIKTPPLQPKPKNIGYEAGWGEENSDTGKTGKTGAKFGTTPGAGAKARGMRVPPRKHQINTITSQRKR
uniref:WD repeat-containing protein 64-like n=1 Tax=Phallusia mammillata TaxID=59560 RepID=A0A6F9DXI7_9ASCI|nr:WD repeat-containing protein 64-like [Phallusia mammillata]